MVRLALTKFMKSKVQSHIILILIGGIAKSYIDSIKMAFENHYT
jgi:hypothetical protein